jgi:hypothetical protein
MGALPENKFATVRDFRDRLSELVDQGLGELPAQVLVVPDSTMQIVARHLVPVRLNSDKPALMIDLDGGTEDRLPVALISTDRLGDGHVASRKVQ